jgi:PilZ domain
LKAGKIEVGGGAIDCTVRNLSKIGAALDVPTPVGIPDEFTLVIPSDELRFACRVVWRKAGRIGVRFD